MARNRCQRHSTNAALAPAGPSVQSASSAGGGGTEDLVQLDDEILADMDHTAEFFTSQGEVEEVIPDEDGEVDEFFEDDEV